MNGNRTFIRLTTYTFTVEGKTFQMKAENRVNAFEAANCKLFEDKLVKPGTCFAWLDGAKPNTFYWQDNVSMN